MNDMIINDLQDCLEENPQRAKAIILALRNEELPELLNRLTLLEATTAIKLLPINQAIDLFNEPALQRRSLILDQLEPNVAALILNEMVSDELTDVLRKMSSFEKHRLMPLLSTANRTEVESLLKYPPASAGGIMTTEFVRLDSAMTVEAAISHIRDVASDRESIYACYVLDDSNKLLGALSLRDLIIATPSSRIADIMRHKPVHAFVNDSQEQVAAKISKYNLLAVPVLEIDGSVVGFVTVDDVIDVLVEEQTDQILQMGGVEAGALDLPYMSTPFFSMIRKRAVWLVLLFLGEMFTATAMGYFEDELSKAVVLALFLPLIISSGGNSGSQATTLVIRAMALGEVRLADWWLIVRRELLTGLFLGAILGAIGFIRIAGWTLFSSMYGPHWALLGITVDLSLVGVVMWGTLSGATLPLILKRVGIDPATSSAPFVATLVDVTGLIIYFTVALIVLKGTIL